mmetsp:Transcript_77375/g.125532  ORF Transcript_77375/g.125532 Transcript_77375/m.125532 type:complete len:222 (-) Transcript_77375:55-720(-)
MAEESVTVKMCRVPGVLRPDQMFFRPALVYQTMFDEHVADAGLEFSIDMSTGKNRARFISSVKVEEGSERQEEILNSQLNLVKESELRQDQAALRKLLLAAGTWGVADRMAQIIRTCYVTESIANPVLVEIAQAGSSEVVRVLVDAGADPNWVEAALDNKTALHAACDAGHEEIAVLLIGRMSPEAIQYTTRSTSCTAMDLLRRAEMNGMARRLEALIVNR